MWIAFSRSGSSTYSKQLEVSQHSIIVILDIKKKLIICLLTKHPELGSMIWISTIGYGADKTFEASECGRSVMKLNIRSIDVNLFVLYLDQIFCPIFCGARFTAPLW